MNSRIFILIIAALPTTLAAQQAKIFSDDQADWKSYHSFSIAPGELVVVTKTELDQEKILNDIRATIVSELTARKMEHKTEGGDLLVDFTGEVVEITNVENIGPLGQQPADNAAEMDQSRTWTQERKEVSLAIEVFEKESKKTVWRSSITLESGSGDLIVVFNAAIGKSLRKFPSRKK